MKTTYYTNEMILWVNLKLVPFMKNITNHKLDFFTVIKIFWTYFDMVLLDYTKLIQLFQVKF